MTNEEMNNDILRESAATSSSPRASTGGRNGVAWYHATTKPRSEIAPGAVVRKVVGFREVQFSRVARRWSLFDPHQSSLPSLRAHPERTCLATLHFPRWRPTR